MSEPVTATEFQAQLLRMLDSMIEREALEHVAYGLRLARELASNTPTARERDGVSIGRA